MILAQKARQRLATQRMMPRDSVTGVMGRRRNRSSRCDVRMYAAAMRRMTLMSLVRRSRLVFVLLLPNERMIQ